LLTLAFLKARYPGSRRSKKPGQTKLADEPFVGMWRDRQDMRDSSAWVQDIREREWEQRS
jgi:hypothetical protein